MQSMSASLVKNDLEPLSLSDLWSTVYRYWKLIAVITMAIVITGFLYAKITPKIYKAEAVILIESQEKNVEIKSVLAEISNDQTLVPTEIQVLMSRNLMGKVLDELKMIKSEKSTPPEELKKLKEEIINSTLKNLEVKQIEKSRAISVSFRSKDPVVAANIVNTLSKLYIDQQISNNFEAIRLTNSWLSERVRELQNRVQESEQKVTDYRAKIGLVQGKDTDLSELNVVDLSRKLNDSKAKLADAEARLSEFQNTATIDSAPSVLSSALIQSLREAEAEAKAELAALSNTKGFAYPQLKEVQAKIFSIQLKIKQEISKIAESTKRQYQSAQENVASIEKQVLGLKSTYNEDMSENVNLAALEREVETNRKFLEVINLRWKETQFQEDSRLQTPYARIISNAAVPVFPASPNTKMILGASLLAGLGLGIGLSLILDQTQNTVYNGKQAQAVTGITNISMIADARLRKNDPMPDFLDIPASYPLSEYMEGIRELSAFLKMQKSRISSEGNVFCFSSSAKSEGKSSLVASLARQLAMEGSKVLVIDCDVRQQSLSKMFDVSDRMGVTELLAGKVKLEDVVIRSTRAGLSIIPVGEGKGDVNLFLKSADAWRKLVTEAGKDYDVILLDNSPSLSTPEAKIIASIGRNIFCIRWKKTPLKVIEFTLDYLRRSDVNVIGTVLTMTVNKENNTAHSIRKSA